jgi:predicted nucleic acid-binding protein
MSVCLDAFAILSWLQDEAGAELTEAFLSQAAEEENFHCFVSIINLGEVYYRIYRTRGPEEADAFWQESQQGILPLSAVQVTQASVLQSARLKARYPIALADAFAVQLAREMDIPLVTGDQEIKVLEEDEVLKVTWLNQ